MGRSPLERQRLAREDGERRLKGHNRSLDIVRALTMDALEIGAAEIGLGLSPLERPRFARYDCERCLTGRNRPLKIVRALAKDAPAIGGTKIIWVIAQSNGSAWHLLTVSAAS